MPIHVTYTENPEEALSFSRDYLAADPVRNNLILSLLYERVGSPIPGRYWVATQDAETVGVVLQSPTIYPANLVCTDRFVSDALVVAVIEHGVQLPGVSGGAEAAASFAGTWVERSHQAAIPQCALRVYEAEVTKTSESVSGNLVLATGADLAVVGDWMCFFELETASGDGNPEIVAALMKERIAQELVWIWHADRPVCMVVLSTPVCGAVRVRTVYTPKELRKCGFASACVTEVTRNILAAGNRPILYVDIGNPQAASVYVAIGYRASFDSVRYSFAVQT